MLAKLHDYKYDPNAVVVGLPRGGMVTASVIAKGLDLPLGFLVVKKIGAPGNPELAIGAVSEEGEVVFDTEISTSIDFAYKNSEKKIKADEARERGHLYRGNNKVEHFKGKTVILTDDGMATGITMITAVKAAILREASKIVVAVPVASSESIEMVKGYADVFVFLVDDSLTAVGACYDDFPQVEDSEVLDILKNAKKNIINR